jgi:methylmalonyl-CoA mutase N-terminal domain/subunit
MIESLTEEIVQRAEDYIKTIDDMGGALKAIEGGYINNEIDSAAYDYQRAIEKGDEIIVGVNKFTVDDDPEPDLLHVDPAIEASQREKLAQLREQRDNEKVSALRGRLETTAKSSENLMPLFIECVENDVTLGEICLTLRQVFGEYRPSMTM